MLQTKNSSDLLLLAGLGGGTLLLESVAETPADDLEVADAAGAGGLPPLGLDGSKSNILEDTLFCFCS